ncbi:MAG: flagellar motor protein MotB, partial [Gammaproteobacteria bacterium]|nr:flagellar motor protein MotB [Gammaproteobacteria bacterium]
MDVRCCGIKKWGEPDGAALSHAGNCVVRRHGPDPHRWLVSYADYMTLLCVFFIMLYAVQLIDD